MTEPRYVAQHPGHLGLKRPFWVYDRQLRRVVINQGGGFSQFKTMAAAEKRAERLNRG